MYVPTGSFACCAGVGQSILAVAGGVVGIGRSGAAGGLGYLVSTSGVGVGSF